jgi:hypothetical protein
MTKPAVLSLENIRGWLLDILHLIQEGDSINSDALQALNKRIGALELKVAGLEAGPIRASSPVGFDPARCPICLDTNPHGHAQMDVDPKP